MDHAAAPAAPLEHRSLPDARGQDARATDTRGTDPRRTGSRRGLVALLAVLLLLSVALRLPAFFVGVFNSDETFLATQGQVVRQGGNLYEEAADRKPPLVPYVYAATFALLGTTALWSVRLMAMLAVALTGFLLALEARRRYGERAGWIAGLLCVLAMVAFAPQDAQAANFEVFMLPAMTASVLLARRGRGAAAGVGVAVATLAKQTGAATLLPVAYLLWKARGRRGVADVATGFTVPLLLVALALGPAQVAYWTVLGNGSYVGIRTASTYVLGMFAVMTLAWAASNLPLLWRLPQAWRERARPALDGGHDVDLWLWAASAAVSVAFGLRFFGHYYMQLVPPLCLLTAGALTRGPRRLVVATFALAALVGVSFSAAGYFMHPFGGAARYETVSRYLVAHAEPTDRVLVWGSMPEVYWASGRRPATRFVTTNTFLAGNHPGRPAADVEPQETDPAVWDWFFDDMSAHPPRFVLDTAPARIRGAEFTPIRDFPRLERLLRTNYRYVRSIDRIRIYERR